MTKKGGGVVFEEVSKRYGQVTAVDRVSFSVAAVARPMSPESPQAPVPATVLITPALTLRTRQLSGSAMYRSEPLTAIPAGK